MLKEFKDFAMRGNIVDLAVAVVLGTAFGAIIKVFVAAIIMPIIGSFIGESFVSLSMEINGVDIMYGLFIQAVISFIFIAFSVFMVVKSINATKKKEVAAPAEAPKPTVDQDLLVEIRDLLKK
jgi:large conductance mechanosensitive channel